jgi:hypothetical protein
MLHVMKTVAEKMGVKSGSRAILVNAPEDAVLAMQLPDINTTQATGKFSYIHLFVITQANMHKHFPKLRKHLEATCSLWLSWPKAKQLATDLTIKKVIEIGYSYGLVESKTLSINSTWSAIKFTHPIEGKEYNNSYGKLHR